jgi:outer membrane receptor protein involved in Fe transport
MTKTLILLLVAFCTQLNFAQDPNSNKINLTGTVIDTDTKVELEYATITLINSKNPTAVSGGITDAKGNFNLEIAPGMYTIKVEYISFAPYILTDKRLTSSTNLGVILLEIDSQLLDEVEVIAEKTTVEIRLDKKIYNVGKDLTVRGGTVSDVLDNVPSVSVDVEGNVALRGNDNVRILINGKPSGLVGLNSTDALRQLPAESIEKVEVITSPSARYDAEGTAGIINIILRRSKLQGVNGAITTNLGYPKSAGISGNLNYRSGDVNFFTTSGYNYRQVPGNSFSDTRFFNTNTSIKEERDFDRIRKGINTNFGVEWYINETSSLTTSILYRDSNNESNTTNLITQTDVSGNIFNSSRFDPELEDDKTLQYSMNFDKKFTDDGHKLTVDFQYETSDEDEQSFVAIDGVESEKVIAIESQNRILLQSDYVLPIGENKQFELGYRGNFNDMTTDYDVDFLVDTGANDPSDNELLDNSLRYKEQINALYTQFGSKINKFSYLLGLRLEDTRITVDQKTSSDLNKKTYANLFPTVNLSYSFTETQSITLGYNRRIRRPRSRFINPFPSRSSATNLFQGNPDIDPSFSNGVDLGYLNRMGKVTLNTSIYYQHATDVFEFISEDTGTTTVVNGEEVPILRRTPINLSSNDRFGFEMNLTYNPTRTWRISGNLNLFQSNTEGIYNAIDFGADNFSWSSRFTNKLTLPAKIDWQTTMFYRGPSITSQSSREGMFFSSMAFSKDLFKDKASLSFNVTDLFNSMRSRSESITPISESYSEFQWRGGRSYNMSFTYRFNQKKKRERGERPGGGDDFEMEG